MRDGTVAAGVALLSTVFFLLFVAALGAVSPPPPVPVDVDVFRPPSIHASPTSGVIADGLRSAGPGEMLTLAGDFKPGVTRFEVFGQTTADNAYRASVTPVSMNGNTAVLLLPAALPTHSTYLVWPSDGAGFGKPFAVNRTDAWWVGPNQVITGERFSVFGRNLTSGDPGRSLVFAIDAGGRTTRLPMVAASPYRIELDAPDLPPGGYDLWTHNGGGGALGWSGPLRFEVGLKAPSPAIATTIDVSRFGALGDGVRDDGPAIERALAAASASAPATLYFPPGVYLSRRAFDAPSGVRWLGADASSSELRFDAPLTGLGAPAFIYGPGERKTISFERLTLRSDGRIDDPEGALVKLEGANFWFKDVILSSWGAMTLKIKADNVLIDGAEITGSGSFMSSSSQLFVSGTTFRMTNDGESAIASWGGHDIAITDNRLVNAAASRQDGNGIGRLFVAQPHFGTTRNLFFSGNQTRDSAPRDCAAVDCNKGEQIIFEFSGVSLQRRPSSIASTTIAFPDLVLLSTPGGAEVVVAGGKGLGQHRRIVSADRGTLTLDRPWDVTPDAATSRFFVTPIAERAVITRNSFEGRATHSAHDSNSTAVLVWGLCFDMIVSGNDISRMRHGVMVAATSGTPQDSVSAPVFTLVENNRIRDGNNGIYTGLTFGYDTDVSVMGGVGNVFRGNDIAQMSNIGVAVDTWDTRGGAVTATVFERNRLRDVRFGVVSGLKLIWSRGAFTATPPDGTRLRQTVLHANTVESRSSAFRSDGFQDWTDLNGSWSGSPPGDRPAP